MLPDGREVHYGHDAAGNLTSLTPPSRPAHTFDYTPVNLTERYTPPDVGSGATATRYSYDLDKQLTRVERPDGLAVDMGYDAAGRLSSVTLPNGTVSYGYSAATGQVTSVSAPGGTALGYTYDGALPTSVTWSGPVAGSVAVAYNNNFQVTQQTVNGASGIAFAYDADGLLRTAGALTLTRNAQNGLLTGTALGSATSTQTYSAFGELATLQYRHGATSQLQTSYTRDDLGRITQLTETVLGVTSTLGYSYDDVGRLTGVTRDGVPVEAYDYDGNGNRLSFTGPGGPVTGTYDAQDRLLTYGSASYSYTANGELVSKTTPAGTTSYDYDVLGNLRTVTLPDATTIEYVIDAQNRRIGRKVNGALVQGFLYAGQLTPAAELDGAGNVVSRFVYATRVNVPDYMVRGGVTYRFVTDHLGSVRLVVNVATGAVAQRIDYDAFGRVTQNSAPGFQPFGFAGGLYEHQTGLVRFGARDYDAETGRWTAKDPIGFAADDPSLYAYVRSDPVNLIDPTGLFPLFPCLKDFFQPFFPELNLDAVQIHNELPWWTRFAPIDVGAITIGSHIYFDGTYDPASISGVALIGHELVHVAQWNRGGVNFGKWYFSNYLANRINGMNGYDAYRNILFEQTAGEFQRWIIENYDKSPCLAACTL